jgi:hypothetical protein
MRASVVGGYVGSPIKARNTRHYGVSEIIALYEQSFDGNLFEGRVRWWVDMDGAGWW